jgi:dipeptidase
MSNWAYVQYNLIHPEIEAKQAAYEKEFVENMAKIDEEAQKLYTESPEKAIDYLTNYSVNQANKVVKEWKIFYHQLFVKYSDGNIITKSEHKEGYKYDIPKLEQPGYGEDWYKKIVKETGDQFKVIGKDH